VYRNAGDGTFSEISRAAGPGITLEKSARGCAFGDFDNDGDVDVVVSNINDLPSLLRNDGRGGHWVKIKCTGVSSNRSAIGARVRLQTGGASQVDEVRSGGSYLSQNDLRLHFGLGNAAAIDVLEIRWPNGKTEIFRDLPADRIYRITEGRGEPEVWQPPTRD